MRVIATRRGYFNRVIEPGEEFDFPEELMKAEQETVVVPAQEEKVIQRPTGNKKLPEWVVEYSEEKRAEVSPPEAELKAAEEAAASEESKALAKLVSGQRRVLEPEERAAVIEAAAEAEEAATEESEPQTPAEVHAMFAEDDEAVRKMIEEGGVETEAKPEETK